jgi:hypothetical protein
MNRASVPVAAVLLLAALTACVPTAEPAETAPAQSPSPAETAAPATPAPDSDAAEPESVEGTVVRFTSDRTSVDVTITEDSPGVRDFLSLLPTELTVEEYAGAEKLAYLPRDLAYEGSPGFDPENGDLIYYTPWGNLGFYYDATGIDYSDSTLEIGTYSASEEELSLLEGTVSVEVVD